MALLKFTTVVALLGLIWAQKTSGLTVSQIMAERAAQTPVYSAGPVQYIDKYGNPKVSAAPVEYFDKFGNPVLSSKPIAATGPAQYYDEFGNLILSNCYPFYNSYCYTIPLNLLSNPVINQQLLQLSNKYGIPLDDLYQFYDLANRSMPSLTPDLDLLMLEEVAKALQQEKFYWSENPYDIALRSKLSLAELRSYLPPGLPDSYLNMMAYMDYLVPNLTPSTLACIESTVTKYCPPSLKSNVDYITYQMQTVARYAFASQVKYVPA